MRLEQKNLYFPSSSTIDRLIWIVSLSDEEKGSTRRVQEDLEPFFQNIKLPFEYFEPLSKLDLVAFLWNIAVLAQSGARPIIQIDAHGNQQNGLKIAASGEFISWPDLNRALQTINRETKNNLCVVSAVCYGLSIIHSLKLTMPSPFLVMIAPEKEVSFGAIEDTLCDFYQDIFSGSDLSLSFGKHLKSYMTLIHSEKVLAMCMARYVRNYCTGVGGEKRREKLLTDALESGIPNNRHNRRAVRKSVKSQIKPDQRLLDRYVDSFLLGKAVSYTMVDLIKLARPGN